MKYNQQKFIFACIILLLSIITLSLQVNLRTDKNHKKASQKHHKSGAQIQTNNTLTPSNLKSMIYTQDTREPSEVEKYPAGYAQAGPFTREQENKLFPQKKYQKDSKAYNMDEATPENIRDQKVLLVSNMTAAKEQFKNSKFFDSRETIDPIAKNIIGEHYSNTDEKKYPIYKNDQKAYYNNIDEKNIFKPQDQGLYVVPINLQENTIYDEFNKKAIERQRLAHRDYYYYDSSALYEAPNHDPIRETLEEHAKLNAMPKSQQFDQYMKQEQIKKDQIQTILGNPQPQFFSDNRPNVVSNIIKELDIQKDREQADKNPLPKIKQNEQAPYYDSKNKQ